MPVDRRLCCIRGPKFVNKSLSMLAARKPCSGSRCSSRPKYLSQMIGCGFRAAGYRRHKIRENTHKKWGSCLAVFGVLVAFVIAQSGTVPHRPRAASAAEYRSNNSRTTSTAGIGGGAEKDFTIVVLPDTQHYTEYYPATFDAQTRWIVDHKTKLNIRFVMHTGDIVEKTHSELEWARASKSMGYLDGVIPYGIAPGNHDLDDGLQSGASGSGTIFRRHFPVSRFNQQPGWGAYYDENNLNRNSSYRTFAVGSLGFIVIFLEWEAPDDVLDWAAGVMRAHPNHRAIIATHFYLAPTSPPRRNTSWPWPRTKANHGEDMWRKFVRLQSNIFMVHSGHLFGEALLASPNDAKKSVYQIVTDFNQRPNGGDGWLRYYTFKPSLNQIRAFTYSATLKKFETDANSQFILPYDMGIRRLQRELLDSHRGIK